MQLTHRIQLILISALALTGLAACNGEGSSTPGIRVTAQTTYLSMDSPEGDPDAVTDPAQEESAIKPLYRSDNLYIELQLGLVNLRAVELQRCESVLARAATGLLNFVFPAAHAHAGHIPAGPAGVIDVLKPDLLVWDLGDLASRPGEYCGIRIELAPPGDEQGSGEDEALDMSGKAVAVSPCHYYTTAGTPRSDSDSETPHECIEAAYSGPALGQTLSFGSPLVLNENNRFARLMLATLYDQWFEDLDMALLPTDSEQQAQLAQNVLDSFYVYSLE